MHISPFTPPIHTVTGPLEETRGGAGARGALGCLPRGRGPQLRLR